MVSATRSVSIAAGTALALLALASPRSQKARFWLNVILYVSSLGICSFWGVVVSLIMAVIPGQRLNINYVVARSFYGLCGTLTGIKFVVEGEENFKKGHPAVLIGNHQSSIDILYLGRIFPKLASIMAKKELKFAPLLGQFMLFSGAVFVNRQSRTDAVKAFDHVGATMKRRGLSLWIFPEGTRSNFAVPDLLPFKKGAFHLAVQAQVPLVPVVCENYNRLFDGKTRFEGGTIRIRVLPPVETTGTNKDNINDLVEKVRTQMLDALKQMDREREAFDVTATAQQVSGPSSQPSVPTNLGLGEAGLGGVAGWMAKLVGTGGGKNYARRADKAEESLRKKGTSGQEPGDYNLVSEGERARSAPKDQAKAQASATSGAETAARQGLTQRKTGESGSSDETEGSTVLVEAPRE